MGCNLTTFLTVEMSPDSAALHNPTILPACMAWLDMLKILYGCLRRDDVYL